jgi:hypothetical protein
MTNFHGTISRLLIVLAITAYLGITHLVNGIRLYSATEAILHAVGVSPWEVANVFYEEPEKGAVLYEQRTEPGGANNPHQLKLALSAELSRSNSRPRRFQSIIYPALTRLLEMRFESKRNTNLSC